MYTKHDQKYRANMIDNNMSLPYIINIPNVLIETF